MRDDQARIEVGRVYDPLDHSGALRLLVDRLWPRGVSRQELQLEAWIPQVAPSTELRKWFAHDVRKWPELQQRYRAELAANPDAVEHCLAWCRKGQVRLLYAARDRTQNHAVVLRQYLEEQITRKDRPK
ncbi:DUF488 domain-containing protein [Aestuariivirga sp.]|uniref:DUF488 domain-containing protein n=1 Tax=Aestuariivirga sp. TaxID=2650926 RepID=UPI003919C710